MTDNKDVDTRLSGECDQSLGWDWREKGVFLTVLALVSFPSTSVFYAAPFAALGLLRRAGAFSYSVLFFCALGLWAGLALVLQVAAGIDVSLPAAIFSILTFAPLWLAGLLSKKMRGMDDESWRWLLNLLAYWLLLQSALGFLAYAVTRNGDMVTGTFGFINFLRGQVTISQVMFTATVFPVSMILVAAGQRALHRWAALAGFAVAILAQSGHQTVFLLAVAAITVPLASGQLKTLVAAVLLGSLVVAGVMLAYPTTYRNAIMWYQKTVLDERSPKREIFDAMLTKFENPLVLLVGAGPGQFCSRAGLIGSGEYLSVRLPGFLVDPSPAFVETIRPGMARFKVVGESSAIAQPFSSAFAIPVEFGLAGSIALLALLLRNYVRLIRFSMRAHGESKHLALCAAIVCLAFLLCCTIENYAEFVQGITIPAVLLILVNLRLSIGRSQPGRM